MNISLLSYGPVVGPSVINDVMRGAGDAASSVLSQVTDCPQLVLWAHGQRLLQVAAHIAAGGAPLCEVLRQLKEAASRPVTPHSYQHGIRQLRGLRFGLGAEPTRAGQRLPVPTGYRKDVYYRTGAPNGGLFKGPFPGALAVCFGQPPTAYHQLVRVWLGQQGKLGDNLKIGVAVGQNGKTIPDSQPGDVYAIPDTWKLPDFNDMTNYPKCNGVAAVLGQGIIGPNGGLVWYPYGEQVDCSKASKDWTLQSDGTCGTSISFKPPPVPITTPCPEGQVMVSGKCQAMPKCAADETYDILTNTCTKKTVPTEASMAGGGMGLLALGLFLVGGTAVGLYVNEHSKKKRRRRRA